MRKRAKGRHGLSSYVKYRRWNSFCGPWEDFEDLRISSYGWRRAPRKQQSCREPTASGFFIKARPRGSPWPPRARAYPGETFHHFKARRDKIRRTISSEDLECRDRVGRVGRWRFNFMPRGDLTSLDVYEHNRRHVPIALTDWPTEIRNNSITIPRP